jgi:ribosomal protein S18 acetylase RimI-like enzyme
MAFLILSGTLSLFYERGKRMKNSSYKVTSMTAADIPFVVQIMTSPRNKSVLNPANMTLNEWKVVFEQNLSDPDEENSIIRQRETPVAWLKLNGLLGSNMAWISMLVVHENYQHQGVGSFAIGYAEKYVHERGFTAMGIHANVENAPAVNCYKNAGYIITEESDCTNGDGSCHRGYTLLKLLAPPQITYRRLTLSDLSPDILKSFHRYQEIKKSWRRIDNEWVLIDNPFIEDWTDEQKRYTVTAGLVPAVHSGGAIFAAYDADKLIGFSTLMGARMGSVGQYLQMDMLHVSAEYRHHGIGRKLFTLAVEAARELGAPRMYISASSSEESQAFYRALGCVHAEEIIPELFAEEPFDVHMEYNLEIR